MARAFRYYVPVHSTMRTMLKANPRGAELRFCLGWRSDLSLPGSGLNESTTLLTQCAFGESRFLERICLGLDDFRQNARVCLRIEDFVFPTKEHVFYAGNVLCWYLTRAKSVV